LRDGGIRYSWVRYWSRLGSDPVTWGGLRPDAELHPWLHNELRTLDDLRDVPCLILLGEAGSGKSDVLAQYAEASPADRTVFLNLAEFGLESLERALGDCRSRECWPGDGAPLELVLDSLDECALQIDTVADVVRRFVDSLGQRRRHLRLRIACRTNRWDERLGKSLAGWWPDDECQTWELQPLSAGDIKQAATAARLDGEGFFEAIEQLDAEHLARWPVTLLFLLGSYRTHESLPATRCDLYEEGLGAMLREHERRREERRLKALAGGGPMRRKVIDYLALLSVFTGRTLIDPDLVVGEPSEALAVADLEGAPIGSPVGLDVFRDALDTPVFSAGPDGQRQWAHYSYPEYLAARLLARSEATDNQILELLTDAAGLVVPSLLATAGWLCGLRPGVLKHVIDRQPELVVDQDPSLLEPQDRAAVVDGLLTRIADQELERDPWFLRRLEYLVHPGLVEQLRPWIGDRERYRIARAAAIRMVVVCGLSALVPLLVERALDPDEDELIRSDAVHGLEDLDGEQALSELKKLAFSPDTSVTPALRSRVLRALWPRHVGTQEVLELLAQYDPSEIEGRLPHFLGHLSTELRDEDLPLILGWIAGREARQPTGYFFAHFLKEILPIGFARIGQPGIIGLAVDAAAIWLGTEDECYEHVLGKETFEGLVQSVANRQRFLAELLHRHPSVSRYRLCDAGLLKAEDFAWCVDRAERAEADGKADEADGLANVLDVLLGGNVPNQLGIILEACSRSRVLADRFGKLFEPVAIDSEEADRCRERHRERTEREAEREARRARSASQRPDLPALVLADLAALEAGDVDAFVPLPRHLTRTSDEEHWSPASRVMPQDSYGWRHADDATRARILEAAEQFLLESECVTGNHGPAGCFAMRLLYQLRPTAITVAIWRKWIGAWIDLRGQAAKDPTGSRAPLDHEILQQGYAAAKQEAITHVAGVIDVHNGAAQMWFVPSSVELLLDDDLGAALLNRVRQGDLGWCVEGKLAELLLKRDVAGAAQTLLDLQSAADADRGRGLRQLLLTYAFPQSFDVLRAQLDSDAWREALLDLAYATRHSALPRGQMSRLDSQQVAEALVALWTMFPPDTDPQHEGAWEPDARDSVADLRTAMRQQLVTRGEYELLEHAADQLDARRELGWSISKARANARQQAWTAPSPAELYEWLRRPRKPISSPEDLLALVTESLERFNASLTGETRRADMLWCPAKPGFRPRGEEYLSDRLKEHLDEDLSHRGLFVGREVRVNGKDRPDLLIDVPARAGHNDRLTVAIEVKGCWHRDLRYALPDQLVKQYLLDAYCRHGIYVCFWFDPSCWSGKRRVAAANVESLRQHLQDQAHEAAGMGYDVRPLVIEVVPPSR